MEDKAVYTETQESFANEIPKATLDYSILDKNQRALGPKSVTVSKVENGFLVSFKYAANGLDRTYVAKGIWDLRTIFAELYGEDA